MINWQHLKNESPMAYEQFQEWLMGIYEFEPVSLPRFQSNRLSWVLYDFFEKKGIIINVTGCLWGSTAEYVYEIQQDGILTGILGYGYKSRTEVEIAAFTHGFSLLNSAQAA